MATSSRYIVSNPGTAGTFLDLGLNGRGVGDPNAPREIVYVNTAVAPTIDRVFVRPGMIVDFTGANATGMGIVYLEGNASDYTVTGAAANATTITLTRGGGVTAESVTVKVGATTSIWFANGAATTDAINTLATGGGLMSTLALAAAQNSVGIGTIVGASQTLSIVTLDSFGETFAVARAGTVMKAAGKQGVDTVYVEAGGSVDATKLGAGADNIYLTGNWADYTKTVSGLNVALTRTVGTDNESVTVAASNGAGNDTVHFADGAMSTLTMRVGLEANGTNWNAVGANGWDSVAKTEIYTPGQLSGLRLVQDTGASAADFVSNNGKITFDLPADHDVTDSWQISYDGGATWAATAPTIANGQVSFTLAGQANGVEDGITYAAGSVAVREISASGQGGAVLKNATAITVDNQALAMTSTVAGVSGSARYLKIYHSDASNTLALTELSIKDASGNAISGWTVSTSTTESPSNLNAIKDGAKGGAWNTLSGASSNITYTNGVSGDKAWILIDLGSVKTVGSVTAWGRSDVPSESSNLRIFLSSSNTTSSSYTTLNGDASIVRADIGAVDGVVNGTGTSVTVNLVGNHPVVSGLGASIGDTIEVLDGATVVGSKQITAAGSWQVMTSLAPATLTTYNNLTIRRTDLAGNVTVSSALSPVTVVPSKTGTPQIAPASDSGLVGDGVTSILKPTLSGTVTAANTTTVTIKDGATTLGTTTVTNNSWTFTPSADLTVGSHSITATVGTDVSSALALIIDNSSSVPTAQPLKAIFEQTDGDLVVSGSAEVGSTGVQVTLIDSNGNPTTIVHDAVLVQNADGTATWTTIFTEAELATLVDGTVTVSVIATDRAGNEATLASDPTFTLVLQNVAPEGNVMVPDAALTRTLALDPSGTIVAGQTLINLVDVDGSPATTGTADDAFVDPNPAGSTNGSLTYSGQIVTSLGADNALGGGDDTYGALPSWLTVTPEGLVQTVTGQPVAAGTYNLHLTATDGAGSVVGRDVTFTVVAGALTLSNTALAAVTNLDVRSDLVLNASEAVSLVDAVNGVGKTITLVDLDNPAHTIVLNLGDAADRALISFADGGTSGTIIRINPAVDLDVNTHYRIEASAGAFVAADASGKTSLVLDTGSGVNFTTVAPATGSVAAASQIYSFTDSGSNGWDQAALAAGKGWVNMAGRGDGDAGTAGTAFDFSTGDLVAYMGKITHSAGAPDSFTVDSNFYGVVTGFGSTDLIYFDDQTNDPVTYGRYSATEMEDIFWGGSATVGAATGNSLVLAQTAGTGGQSYLDFTVTGAVNTYVDGIATDGVAGINTLQELAGSVPIIVA